jgi:hypothetical protein
MVDADQGATKPTLSVGPLHVARTTISLGDSLASAIVMSSQGITPLGRPLDPWTTISDLQLTLTPFGGGAKMKAGALTALTLFAPTGVSASSYGPKGSDSVSYTLSGPIFHGFYGKLPTRGKLPKPVRKALVKFVDTLNYSDWRSYIFADPVSAFGTFASQEGISAFVQEIKYTE